MASRTRTTRARRGTSTSRTPTNACSEDALATGRATRTLGKSASEREEHKRKRYPPEKHPHAELNTVRGESSRQARGGGLVDLAAARAWGGTAPLGRARARDARDLHHHTTGSCGSAPLGGAAPGRGVMTRFLRARFVGDSLRGSVALLGPAAGPDSRVACRGLVGTRAWAFPPCPVVREGFAPGLALLCLCPR